jgi:hypothetical protein
MTTTNTTQLFISNGLSPTPPTSSILINYDGIVLGGDLTTTPIYATLGQNGLSTTNVNGFNVLSPFNMNGNDITLCSSVSNSQGNITISSVADDVNLSTNAICSIVAGTTNISANDILSITGTTAVIIEGTNDLINLNAQNGVFVNKVGSSGGDGQITANTFNGYLNGTAAQASSATTSTTSTNSNNILITTDNTSGTYYIPFSKSSGTANKALFQDDTTTPLSYNPSTSTLTATNFSGLSSNSTNATNAVNCSTTSTTTSGTYYPVFVSSNITGNYPNLVGVMTYNPSSNTITANTFNGALSGTATSASAITLTSDNTSGTYYIPFAKLSAGSARALYLDDTTGPLSYNPSTSTLTSTNFSGLLDTGGLVYLSTSQIAITGSASAQNLTFSSIFNSTYKNYRVVLNSSTQVSFTAYPSYSLAGWLGTSVPTTGSLYGNELVSSAPAVITAVYTAGATLSSAPLLFAVSALTNKQIIIEIENVGFANTATQVVGLKCKSFYGNPGVSGYRDAHIISSSLNGATISGITIQQSSLGVGNNMTIQAVVYGYK